MTTIEILTAVLALISKPGGWTQHAYARSADRKSVRTTDPQAVSFDLSGAISRVLNLQYGQVSTEHDDAVNALKAIAETPLLSLWNDRPVRTQRDAIDLVRRGIAAERAKVGAA